MGTHNLPNLNGASVTSFFAPGGEGDELATGIEKFFKSFLGWLDRNSGFTLALGFITNLFTKGWTGAIAGLTQGELAIKQGDSGTTALTSELLTGQNIGKHPLETIAGAGIFDSIMGVMSGHKSLFQLGKDLYHRLVDNNHTAPNPHTAPTSASP